MLMELANNVKGGILVFFSSYEVIMKYKINWMEEEPGAWSILENIKPIF